MVAPVESMSTIAPASALPGGGVPAPAGGSAARDPSGDDVIALLRHGAVRGAFQPIVSLADGAVVGFEALARMRPPAGTGRGSPDRWLAAADGVGRRTELELRCLEAALAPGPPPGGALLFVNLSPSVLPDRRLHEWLDGDLDRVVLELSESQIIDDYEAVGDLVRAWTSQGARLAIDDTGSGYASLRHVLQLGPDFIKLDRSLIDHIDHDRNRRALARAMVAFASELGAAVVAEGVERPGELETLRDVGVELVQGYLLARPGDPWPTPADARLREPSRAGVAAGPPSRPLDGLADLAATLSQVTSARDTCAAVVDHLARHDGLMPSAYLLQGDRLRCQAQRGLWQVLDGLAPGAGITGRCYVTERELRLDDVRGAPGYREAIPGITAEVCVPIRVEGLVAGALNVESRQPIPAEVVDEVRAAARLLGERLVDVGQAPTETPYERLGHHVRAVAAARTLAALDAEVVRGALHVSGLSSAVLTRVDDRGRDHVVAATGPLRSCLDSLSAHQLRTLAGLVEGTTSCYTAGTTLDQGFIGMDELRRQGVRALVVVPLLARGRRQGLLAVAHDSVCSFDTSDVEPLEILALQAAARLDAET